MDFLFFILSKVWFFLKRKKGEYFRSRIWPGCCRVSKVEIILGASLIISQSCCYCCCCCPPLMLRYRPLICIWQAWSRRPYGCNIFLHRHWPGNWGLSFFLFHPFCPNPIIAFHLFVLFFLFIFLLSKTLEVNIAKRKWIYFTVQFKINKKWGSIVQLLSTPPTTQ